MRDLFYFWGSHGAITCDPTGKVVDWDDCDPACDCGGVGYRDVVRVDLAEWQQWRDTTPYPDAGEDDIVNVTLHYANGDTAPFEPEHRALPFHISPED